MIELELENKLNKMINRLTFMSRKFSDKYCFADGFSHIVQCINMKREISKDVLYNVRMMYDYDYYAFTKSTKTLNAIKCLLNNKEYNFNEDIMNLTRSIFENHIMSRYFRENISSTDIESNKKLVDEFIRNPLGVSLNFYEKKMKSVMKSNKLRYINKDGDVIGDVKNGPSSYKLGIDKDYYTQFYGNLSEYSHCSFSKIGNYFDGSFFTYDKNNHSIETLLYIIFVFTKIVEGIATVKGEGYDTEKEEKSYYDLVYDSLELQKEVFDYLIEYKNEAFTQDSIFLVYYVYDEISKNIDIKSSKKEMLINMKNSLDEEIGSVVKSNFDENGKYIRYYPK